MKRKELFEEYSLFLEKNRCKSSKSDKSTFTAKLASIGITSRKSNGCEVYDAISADKFLEMANKFNWLHESDDFEEAMNPEAELKANEDSMAEYLERPASQGID